MMSLRSFAPLSVLVSTALLGGCQDTFGTLELQPAVGIATVPFLVLYERPMEKWCDTGSKINPEECRQSSEKLTVLSATCDAPGCVVESVDSRTLRVTAAQAGAPVVRLEARGESSGETVTAEVTLEVLDPANVDVEVTLRPSYEKHSPYTALGERGRAYVGLTATDPATGRTIHIPDGQERWNVTGGLLDEDSLRLVEASSGSSKVTVEAVLSESVSARASLDVVAAADSMRSVVAATSDEPFTTEPTEILAEYGRTYLFVALEDAAGRRFPGGADRVRVEGEEGCELSEVDDGLHLNTTEGVRYLSTPDKGSCTVVVRDGAVERRIPARRFVPPKT